MSTDHLPSGVLRSICREPITPCREEDREYASHVASSCDTLARTLIVIVPGIAESGALGLLTPLVTAIRERIPREHGALVAIAPTPWPLEIDIPGYAELLRRFIVSKQRLHPGYRLALVGFSLGGTAQLYCVARSGSEISRNGKPLLILLASPVYGSCRYLKAWARWHGSSKDDMGMLETLVGQLRPDSPVMTDVCSGLMKHDAHLVISVDDRIVDRSTACPPGYDRVTEIDMCTSSSLQRHFAFPRHPAVIDEVSRLLGSHLAKGCLQAEPSLATGVA